MKKKLLSFKTLLVAAGLLAGANAWATIDLPNGYEITKAYIGTLSAGVITPETFDDYTIGSEWSIVTNKSGDNVKATSTLTITEVTEVEKPATVGTSNGYLDSSIIPTYVSGKVLTGTISNPSKNTSSYTQHRFTYDLGETLTDGYLVFSADLFNAGNEKTTPERILFLDEDGNEVLQFLFKSGNNQQLYQIIENGTARTWSGMQATTRSDTGYGIKDLTLNIAEGTGSISLDFIHYSGSGRYRDQGKTTLNFGTGHNIRYVAFAREEYSSSGAKTELTYLDNVELYRLQPSASSHTWTVNANCGGTLIQLATGQAENGMDYKATGLPKVIENDNKFYVLDDNTVTDYSTQTYTMGDGDEAQTITYTIDNDIVYFNDLTSATSTGQSTTASGGSYGAWNTNQNIALAAGEYTIYVYTWGKYGNYWRGEIFKINGVEVARIVPGEAGETSVDIIVPDASTPITIVPQNSYTSNLDYILIKKNGNLPSTVTKTIGEAGYATYCSPYNLDLGNVAGLTAYTATVADNTVTFTEVDGIVPAYTGVLLKGDAKEYSIPVATTTSNVTSALIGVTTSTEVAAGSFVLLKGDEGVGFYKTTAAFTVGANTAYLPALSGDAKVRFIGLDGSIANSITAIGQSDNLQFDNSIYNLNGQRVAAPTKGLYIVNGKKVFIK